MFKLWHNVVHVALAAMVIASLVLVFGPPLETKFFPAYSRFEIIEIAALPDGNSQARFRFTKLRSCAPAGFAWYAGDPAAAFRQLTVTVEYQEGEPPVRPLGVNLTSSYVIDVDPQVLRDGVYAEVFSRCWPFWVTRSVIYP